MKPTYIQKFCHSPHCRALVSAVLVYCMVMALGWGLLALVCFLLEAAQS